jgi:hypothetical protein
MHKIAAQQKADREAVAGGKSAQHKPCLKCEVTCYHRKLTGGRWGCMKCNTVRK